MPVTSGQSKRKQVWRSSTVRMAVVSTIILWLAAAAVATTLHQFTVNALVKEATNDIDLKVRLRMAGWEKQDPAKVRASDWLYGQLSEGLAMLSDCVRVVDEDGVIELNNISTVDAPKFCAGEYYAVNNTSYRWHPTPETQPNTCLVKDIPLADGGVLTYGAPFDSYHTIIRKLDSFRLWGLMITAFISIFIGLTLSWRAVTGMRRINRVCELVAEGDLQQRVTIRSGKNDLQQLGASVNHMLDQINQLMGGIRQVSDSIAHDLKTPLARLRGQLELMMASPERSDEELQSVIDKVDGILDTFNALLRISQLEQGSTRQAFELFDINSLIEDLNNIYQLVFEEKNIHLHIEPCPQALDIYGDRKLWLQAFANLLDNAYKYTPDGGRCSLQFKAEDEQALAILSDSGPGIPEQEHSQVFKRFYHLEKHRSQSGLGLGLSGCHKIT